MFQRKGAVGKEIKGSIHIKARTMIKGEKKPKQHLQIKSSNGNRAEESKVPLQQHAYQRRYLHCIMIRIQYQRDINLTD